MLQLFAIQLCVYISILILKRLVFESCPQSMVRVRMCRNSNHLLISIKSHEVLVVVFAIDPIQNNLLTIYLWTMFKLLLNTLLKSINHAIFEVKQRIKLLRDITELVRVYSQSFESKKEFPVLNVVFCTSLKTNLNIFESVPNYICQSIPPSSQSIFPSNFFLIISPDQKK